MLIYTYDGSFEGFLCCIFEAYTRGEDPAEIAAAQGLQYRIDQELRGVPTIEERWQRVRAGIHHKLGRLTWQKLRACFCASTPDKEMLLYRYLKQGFARGRVATDDILHPDILPIEELYRSVGNEQQRMIMFARFAHIPEGVYCATINPKHSVLPLIMDHFAARFNVQPFIVYDEVHQLAGISERGEWYLSAAEGLCIPPASFDDQEYQQLWQTFYHAIAIPGRRNEKLRQQFMPKRLWKNIPEMHPAH
ncbi:MAG: TIGR03915 family putative DNA repair protein [Coriobacteriia bacterium]|nr:TIGR03915 family putative DNA repair protein [Coriobacteriia bacterium]